MVLYNLTKATKDYCMEDLEKAYVKEEVLVLILFFQTFCGQNTQSRILFEKERENKGEK